MLDRNGGTAMTDVAGIITAVGGVIALLVKVCGLPQKKRKAVDVAAHLEALDARLGRAEDRLLGWAEWAHDARMTAASNGVRLPLIPGTLLSEQPAIPAPRVQADTAVHADA